MTGLCIVRGSRRHSCSTAMATCAIFSVLLQLLFVSSGRAQPFDVVVRHGRIVDGSGNPWYRADLGIRGSRIVVIGDLAHTSAKQTIDAHDDVVAPGFIDMMGGDSYVLVEEPNSVDSKLQQGCTTMLVGEGYSEAPQNDVTAKALQKEYPKADVTWHSFKEYSDLLTRHGIGMNVIHNVGAAQVREIVLGDTNRRAPTPEELDKMKALVTEAMQQGAVGISSALIYPPGNFATTQELVALATAVAPYGGIYLTHVRDEGSHLLEGIAEAISIGEQAGIPVHIYHLKAAGAENWHLIDAALQRIQAARNRGVEVTADAYPYLYNGLNLGSFIPPDAYSAGKEALERSLAGPTVRQHLEIQIKARSDWENWYLHIGSDWNNVLIAKVPPDMDTQYEGLSLHQVAVLRGKDDWTTFFDLVQQGDPSVSPRSMNEEQKRAIYREPWVSISSDASPADSAVDAHVHPRAYGTFPRIYAKYVREDPVLTLEDAVRKMTSLPADLLGLFDRGRIAPGMVADLVIFNPDRIQDTATFTKPAVYPKGIDDVFVNGVLAIDHGRATGELSGKVLSHKSPASAPGTTN
jgi:N-acyl-D-amino-acid deacylase